MTDKNEGKRDWRTEPFFGKGEYTNRPMTEWEIKESQKVKDIQDYIDSLSSGK